MKSSNRSLGKSLGQYLVLSLTLQVASLSPKRHNLFFLPTVTQLIKSPSPMPPSNAKQSVFSSSSQLAHAVYVCVNSLSQHVQMRTVWIRIPDFDVSKVILLNANTMSSEIYF